MKTIYIKLLRMLLIKFPHCRLADWGMFERHREQKAAPETGIGRITVLPVSGAGKWNSFADSYYI